MNRISTYRSHPLRFVLLTALAVGCLGLFAVGVQALIPGEEPDTGPMSSQTRLGVAARAGAPREIHRELGQACRVEYCPKPPLIYWGGTVQHNPAVYVIFWGSNWSKEYPQLSGQIVKMYRDFSGSKYQSIMTQYFDSGGHISNTVKVTSYTDSTVTAPKSVTKAAMLNEMSEAINTNNWPKEPDGQYVVIPAPGSGYSENFHNDIGCGYHERVAKVGLNFSFVPYIGDSPFREGGCGTSGNLYGETTATAAHEFGESETDPIPTQQAVSWATAEGYEITDICSSGNDQLPDGIWVEGQWDNYKNECALSDATPAWVYTITEPATEVKTTEATLNGTINPENMATEYYFEWGLKPTFGMETAKEAATTNWTNQRVKKTITGLTAHTFYYYVLVGKNSKGTAKGRQQKFETA